MGPFFYMRFTARTAGRVIDGECAPLPRGMSVRGKNTPMDTGLTPDKILAIVHV